MNCNPAFFALVFLSATALMTTTSSAGWMPDGSPVVKLPSQQHFQRVVSDGAGGVIVVWEDDRNVNYDVYAQRVDGIGTMLWTINGIPVASGTHDERNPEIASDGAGGAIVVWVDYRNADNLADVYAQRIDASGALLWAAGGVPVAADANESGAIDIDADGFGGAVITWSNNFGANTDIYAQRIDASGSPLWTTNGVAVCALPQRAIRPSVVSDGAGACIIVWGDERAGVFEDDIYAQSLNFLGSPVWVANGKAMTTAAGTQRTAELISDGFGGAIACWLEENAPTYISDISAQRVDATGTMLWGANGTTVCNASGNQSYYRLVSDNSGGAVIAWMDQRNAGIYDIYAQNMSFLGSASWGTNGIPVCTATDHQWAPDVVRTASGNYFVTWYDYRNVPSGADIYAQLLNAAGTSQWMTDGVAVCTAPGDQGEELATAAGDGAIIAWTDSRDANTDVYVDRVASNGATVVGEPVPFGALALSANVPNPFSKTTFFELDLSHAGAVTIDVFDVAGRHVSAETRELSAGPTRLEFKGRGRDGHRLASGVYFYRVTTEEQTVTRKIVITR